ncbi:MAG TPA: PHB depolymerase family esterase [Acidimicrobiales bacterium]|nr:PHB depolymerase family esterase [Acidimicrobiales bacterium]
MSATARRRRLGVVGSLLIVVTLVAGCDRAGRRQTAPPSATTTAAPACPPSSATPGETTGAFTFDRLDRTYLVHIPPSYDGRRRMPLVFNFHGHGSSAPAQQAYAAFGPLADREGFLVVAPDGQGTPRHFTLLGPATGEADDVAFTLALLDDLEARLCVDAERVFATGMSNGGALSSVLACRASSRIAAAGAVAAMIFVPPCDDGGPPAPFVGMMGDADPVVPFAGGRVNCCGNPTIPGAEDTVQKFADRAGCDAHASDVRPSASVVHRVWTGCAPGAAVELYVIEGGGHTWPGSAFDLASRGLGATTDELSATDTLWAFFEAHPLRRT